MDATIQEFYTDLDKAIKEINNVCSRHNSACPVEIRWALDAKAYVTFQELMSVAPKEKYLSSDTFPNTGKIHLGNVVLNFAGKKEAH